MVMGKVNGKYQFNKGYPSQISSVIDIFLQAHWKVGGGGLVRAIQLDINYEIRAPDHQIHSAQSSF